MRLHLGKVATKMFFLEVEINEGIRPNIEYIVRTIRTIIEVINQFMRLFCSIRLPYVYNACRPRHISTSVFLFGPLIYVFHRGNVGRFPQI